MNRFMATVMITGGILAGCGGQQPATTPAEAPAVEAPAKEAVMQESEVPAMRNFAAVKIGPYDVQPMFEEEIPDGHYNIEVKGGEVKAVRVWVGPEDASGVMVSKTEIEHTYHHGHVELPDPIPADAMLWIEIEAPDGTTVKGSTPLKAAV